MGGVVRVVARSTEESVRVLAGVKFFLQAIQMDWGPCSLLLCGYGKLSGRKLKLTTHLSQLLHSPIHFHGTNRNNFTSPLPVSAYLITINETSLFAM